MSVMLPAAPDGAVSLADIVPSCLAATCGERNPLGLPAVDRAVVVLVDGLGSAAVRARAGHARFIAARLAAHEEAWSVFPSTTSAALATLNTGAPPSEHGLVGYRVLDPGRDRLVNVLSGWDRGMDPERWQRRETVYERARQRGIDAVAIGQGRYRDSGFTRAVLRGARYVGAESIAARFDAARAVLDAGSRSLVYVYLPELDQIAHARGWRSESWASALDEVDGLLAGFCRGLGPGEGAIVTADHGILDVPSERQVRIDEVDGLLDGVRHLAGEPRGLQLHLEPGVDPDAVADRWRRQEGDRAWVATRAEAHASGWFGGALDAPVRPRVGDVLVAAREDVAYYDAASAPAQALAMVGQHGSSTDTERRVPCARAGAFARG